eukprot:512580-Amphidinium_carterae.1
MCAGIGSQIVCFWQLCSGDPFLRTPCECHPAGTCRRFPGGRLPKEAEPLVCSHHVTSSESQGKSWLNRSGDWIANMIRGNSGGSTDLEV